MTKAPFRYFDFNIHLPPTDDLAQMIDIDLNITLSEMKAGVIEYLRSAPEGFIGGNIMIFNRFINPSTVSSFKSFLSEYSYHFTLTLLCCPSRFSQRKSDISLLKEAGIDFIKFHSYIQEISEDQIPSYISLFEMFDLPLLIDCSYGSPKLYKYNGLHLASEILLNTSSKQSIVLLHSGGCKIHEALQIAESYPNVFLDTSLSLPYYLDSNLGHDFNFAYSKLHYKRVFYGSDSPCVDAVVSMSSFKEFANRLIYQLSLSLIFYQKIICSSSRIHVKYFQALSANTEASTDFFDLTPSDSIIIGILYIESHS